MSLIPQLHIVLCDLVLAVLCFRYRVKFGIVIIEYRPCRSVFFHGDARHRHGNRDSLFSKTEFIAVTVVHQINPFELIDGVSKHGNPHGVIQVDIVYDIRSNDLKHRDIGIGSIFVFHIRRKIDFSAQCLPVDSEHMIFNHVLIVLQTMDIEIQLLLFVCGSHGCKGAFPYFSIMPSQRIDHAAPHIVDTSLVVFLVFHKSACAESERFFD